MRALARRHKSSGLPVLLTQILAGIARRSCSTAELTEEAHALLEFDTLRGAFVKGLSLNASTGETSAIHTEMEWSKR